MSSHPRSEQSMQSTSEHVPYLNGQRLDHSRQSTATTLDFQVAQPSQENQGTPAHPQRGAVQQAPAQTKDHIIRNLELKAGQDQAELERLSNMANDAIARTTAVESELRRLRSSESSSLPAMSARERVQQIDIEQELELNLQMLREENGNLSRQLETLSDQWQLRLRVVEEQEKLVERSCADKCAEVEQQAGATQAEHFAQVRDMELRMQQMEADMEARLRDMQENMEMRTREAEERSQDANHRLLLAEERIREAEERSINAQERVLMMEDIVRKSEARAREADSRVEHLDGRVDLQVRAMTELPIHRSPNYGPNFRPHELAWDGSHSRAVAAPRSAHQLQPSQIRTHPPVYDQNSNQARFAQAMEKPPQGLANKGSDTYFWEFLNSTRGSSVQQQSQPQHSSGAGKELSAEQQRAQADGYGLSTQAQLVLPEPVLVKKAADSQGPFGISLTWGGKSVMSHGSP